MTIDKRSEYLPRNSILSLLSDEEVACVSTAETAATLADDDEYIDLSKLARGVQRAHGSPASMASVLPRRAVAPATWSKIVTGLRPGAEAPPK